MRAFAVTVLLILILVSCGVPRSRYEALNSYALKLRNDSILLDKRVRQLSDERAYLGSRSAEMEQALTQRLQEKEDSLNHKESLLTEKESSIRDMKARKAEEKDAFETLARSVFEIFGDYSANDVNRHTNCTQVIVEVADRLLYFPGTTKVDAAKAQAFLIKVAKAIEKNPDLSLVVVSHTDSAAGNRERMEDGWALGAAKANSLVRILQKDYKVPAGRIASGTKAETVGLMKANAGMGRNRVEFIFFSNLLPCIHSKE